MVRLIWLKESSFSFTECACAERFKTWKQETRSSPIVGAGKKRHFECFSNFGKCRHEVGGWHDVRCGCRLGRHGCHREIWWFYVKQGPNYSTRCRLVPFYAVTCSIHLQLAATRKQLSMSYPACVYGCLSPINVSIAWSSLKSYWINSTKSHRRRHFRPFFRSSIIVDWLITVAEYSTLWPSGPVLRTFVQYIIPFCNRSETASDVLSGKFYGTGCPDKYVKFRDHRLNHSWEISPEGVAGGIFYGFFAITSDWKLLVMSDPTVE